MSLHNKKIIALRKQIFFADKFLRNPVRTFIV